MIYCPRKGPSTVPVRGVGGQFIAGAVLPRLYRPDGHRLKASYAAQNGGTQRRSPCWRKVSWLSVWYSLQEAQLSEDMNYIDAL
ncbi:MAG: hypothetical protein ACLRJV_15940 [Eubacteriales bacterium]